MSSVRTGFEPMRFEPVLGPDARHGHVRDVATKFGSELARGPVRGTIGGVLLWRARQHTRFKAVGDLVALATGMARKQACQTVSAKALAPESNVAVIAIELGPDGAPGQALGKQQDQTRTTRQIRSNGPSIGLLAQFHDFGFGQVHRVLQGGNFTIYLNVMVH